MSSKESFTVSATSEWGGHASFSSSSDYYSTSTSTSNESNWCNNNSQIQSSENKETTLWGNYGKGVRVNDDGLF